MSAQPKHEMNENERRLAETARGTVIIMGERLRTLRSVKPRLRRCKACRTAIPEEDVRCHCSGKEV